MVEWLKFVVMDAAPMAADYAQKRSAPFSDDSFVATYADLLRDGTDILLALATTDDANTAIVEKGAKALLITIGSVVRAYYAPATIHTNYMEPEAPTEALLDQAKFCRRDRKVNSFGCFLVLRQWADDSHHFPAAGELVLPVEKAGSRDTLLFGAPEAYVNNRPSLVPDTSAYELRAKHNDGAVGREIQTYFDEHSSNLKSFVSLPITVPNGVLYTPSAGCSKDVLGVVNVQSNRTHLLGRFRRNQAKLQLLLVPFVHMLAYHLLKAHELRKQGA